LHGACVDKPHKPIHHAVPKKAIDVIIEEQKKRLIVSEDKNERVSCVSSVQRFQHAYSYRVVT
jgi:hypothetical protein